MHNRKALGKKKEKKKDRNKNKSDLRARMSTHKHDCSPTTQRSTNV